jgi:transposase-like protein
VVRAKTLLLAYEHPDWSNAPIARAVGCTDRTVRKWRRRTSSSARTKPDRRQPCVSYAFASGVGGLLTRCAQLC